MVKQDYSKLVEQIKIYQKIIIVTHAMPDYDAIGSQLGLLLGLKSIWPNKTIVAVGETIHTMFESLFTSVSDSDYEDALVIITDSGAAHLLPNLDYKKGAMSVGIDHHLGRTLDTDLTYVDTTSISACLMIFQLLDDIKVNFTVDMARLLLLGIVTDSGRFRYSNTDSDTFYVASKLLKTGVDLQEVYGMIYRNSLEKIRYKGHVMSHFKIYKERIAYMVNTKADVKASGISFFEITRGMVNAMADIDGIDVWCNFTETEENIKAEFRSKVIPIVEVAKAFGGGGHKLACGASLETLEDIDRCLEALYKVL